MVTAVTLSSLHPLPEGQVRAAMGDLTGKPLSRDAVRDALDRLWGLGLFSAIHVDEIPEPGGGVSLRWQFTERPLIRKIAWEGESGIDLAEVAATAGLAIGEEASPSRLAKAERDLVARYRRDGYLGARVLIREDPVADSSERDVTVILKAGEQARIGRVQLLGETGLPADQIVKVLKLPKGSRYRESLVQDGARAVEERLRQDGYYEARVTAGQPAFSPDTNEVSLDVHVTAGPDSGSSSRAFGAARIGPQIAAHLASSGSTDAFEQEASAHEIEAAYRSAGTLRERDAPRVERQGHARHSVHDRRGSPCHRGVDHVHGHLVVPAARLAEQMETRRPALFRRGLFRRDVLDHDVGVVPRLSPLAGLCRGHGRSPRGPFLR
jgi:outer membrane translocation and assembly module TamA